MIIRTVLTVSVLALCTAVVMAQTDPIKTRQSIMKGVGDQAKIGAGMAKGEAPFDLAKAQKIFATFVDASEKMPALFPPDSKTGEETAALPAIWEKMDDFKAKFAKFGTDAKAAEASVKDLDSFKAAFTGVTKNCGGCHETYRAKKS